MEESREVPATAVASTARIMAARWAWLALIPGVLLLLLVLGDISYHQRKGFPHGVGPAIGGWVVMFGVPLGLVIWFLVRARRYSRHAKLAATDTGLTWHLSGSLIVAADAGVPRPELTFSVARYLRRALIAVPRAIQVK